jgi:hypothetical protein
MVSAKTVGAMRHERFLECSVDLGLEHVGRGFGLPKPRMRIFSMRISEIVSATRMNRETTCNLISRQEALLKKL